MRATRRCAPSCSSFGRSILIGPLTRSARRSASTSMRSSRRCSVCCCVDKSCARATSRSVPAVSACRSGVQTDTSSSHSAGRAKGGLRAQPADRAGLIAAPVVAAEQSGCCWSFPHVLAGSLSGFAHVGLGPNCGGSGRWTRSCARGTMSMRGRCGLDRLHCCDLRRRSRPATQPGPESP